MKIWGEWNSRKLQMRDENMGRMEFAQVADAGQKYGANEIRGYTRLSPPTRTKNISNTFSLIWA